MRHVSCLLLAILLLSAPLLAADPAPPATQPASQTIQVKTVQEFIAALGSNRIIQLAPGDYDLSEIEHKTTRNYRFGLDSIDSDDSLVIRHIENLTIECLGDKPATFSTPNANINVLTFNDAANITLKNLTLVHDVPSGCAAGVLLLNECRNFTLDKCTLSGCGTIGITAGEVDGLVFRNSTITNCSQRILMATELTNSQFIDSKFTGNKIIFQAFHFITSPDVKFTNCQITNNKPAPGQESPETFISTDDSDCKITFTACTLSNNTGDDFHSGDGKITLKDCKITDNTFDPDHPAAPRKPRPGIGKGMGAGRGGAE